LQLLILYPTAQRLSHAEANKVAQLPYISMSKALRLIEKAKTSVASSNDPFTENLIISLVREICHKQRLIDQQTKLMTSHCQIPEVELLKTIPALGTYSAIGLVLEIGCVDRFCSAKKLASFFGLHPKYKQSGDGVWGMRMSKEGRSQPRSILFMVTMVAIQHNPIIQEVFVRNLNKGKCKMDAIGICMHKMLRIIYGMLKSNTPFDPDIDRQNRSKKPVRKKGLVNKNLRRFQETDPDAPVSFRHNKKRKEQHESQGEHFTEHEIKVPALSSVDT
ncbi:MAG: transposase, partial [Sulfurovum sp.]